MSIIGALTRPGRLDDNEVGGGGQLIVQPVNLRTDLTFGEDGDPAYSLRTGGGGSSKPMVCITGEVTHTLTSEGADVSEDGTGRGTPIIYQCHGSNVGPMGTLRQGNGAVSGGVPFAAHTSGVRRLTPTECERLQGFPDGHTENQSDSARYRQLGNAVAVPVVEWIAHRLVGASRSRCREETRFFKDVEPHSGEGR